MTLDPAVVRCPRCLGEPGSDAPAGKAEASDEASGEAFYGGGDRVCRDTFRRLLEASRRLGPSAAVAALYSRGEISRAVATAGGPGSRGAALVLLNPGRGRRILVAGCQLGELSLPLARAFGECYVLAGSSEQAEFLALRAREAGATNLTAVCGGGGRLPFDEGTFDCVVLESVVERSAGVRGGDAARHGTTPLGLVREAHRILRPDGLLYLAAPNSFSLARLGVTTWRSARALPRAFAGAVARKVYGPPGSPAKRTAVQTLLRRSRRGYRRLLSAGGFPSARFFVPLPDSRNIRTLVDAQGPAACEGLRAELGYSRVEALLKARLLSAASDSYAILAAKRDRCPPEPWYERFSANLATQLGWESGILPPARVTVTRTGIAALTLWRRPGPCGQKPGEGTGAAAFVKVPLHADAAGSLRREHQALRALMEACSGSTPPFAFPAPLAAGEFEAVDFAAQTFLSGKGNSPDREQHPARAVAVGSFLNWSAGRAYHSDAAGGMLHPKRLGEAMGQSGLALSARVEEKYLGLLRAAGTDRVPCHGDLWTGNVIPSGDGYAIIDWADFQADGMPLHDAFHYHLYTDGDADHWELMVRYARDGFPAEFSARVARSVRGFQSCLPTALTPERVGALFILYVADNVVRRALRAPFRTVRALQALETAIGCRKLPGLARFAQVVSGDAAGSVLA